jgi:hypothetical protein
VSIAWNITERKVFAASMRRSSFKGGSSKGGTFNDSYNMEMAMWIYPNNFGAAILSIITGSPASAGGHYHFGE